MSGQKRITGKFFNRLLSLPVLLATSIGLGVNNGRAVIEALVGYKTGFVRTPKIGQGADALSLKNSYQANSQTWATSLELVMAVLYSVFLGWAIYHAYWIVTPFLILFALGFFFTSLSSLKESFELRRVFKRSLISAAATNDLTLSHNASRDFNKIVAVAE